MELWTAGTGFLLHRIKTVLKGRVKGIAEIWSERIVKAGSVQGQTEGQAVITILLKNPLFFKIRGTAYKTLRSKMPSKRFSPSQWTVLLVFSTVPF
jgi:hypothetical protein